METAAIPPERVSGRNVILGVMSAGHGAAHLYDQGFPVLLPTISAHFRLTTFQVALLQALRFTGMGAVNIGGGLAVDMLKRHWGIILTGCMFSAGALFAIVGAAPSYVVLMLIAPLVTLPGAIWHMPSAASLSQIFPDKRGLAISIHGLGSNLGNIVGPIVATSLLVALGSWRGVMFVYVLPALLMGVVVWAFLRNVGRIGDVSPRPLGLQMRESLSLLRNPTILMLVAAGMLRGVGLDAMFAWTPFYLEETLDKGHLDAGFHYALLSGTGIASAPLLGWLSDRLGRKAVLAPGFAIAAALSLATVWAGGGLALTLVLAGSGLFSFALHQIVQAAALDQAGEGTEGTTVGLIFGLNGILGAVSPFLGYFVIENFGGYAAVYYYAAGLTAISAALVAFAPMRMPSATR